jgi:hypothetical protein
MAPITSDAFAQEKTRAEVRQELSATQFEECFVNVSATLKANGKTTKIVEACMSTLDHPAKFAEATFTTSIRRVVSSILGD